MEIRVEGKSLSQEDGMKSLLEAAKEAKDRGYKVVSMSIKRAGWWIFGYYACTLIVTDET